MSAARRSQYASKQYPNLYRFPDSVNFAFQKWSSEKVWYQVVDGVRVERKGREFYCSTGESKNAAKAYAIGLQKFNEWLGKPAAVEAEEAGRPLLFGAYAREKLDKKLTLPDAVFSRNSKRTSTRDYEYLIHLFGHLRLDQMTPSRWKDHFTEALGVKPQKFFNRRKALVEIMLAADADGLLPTVGLSPKQLKERLEYENPDEEEDHGEYLEHAQVRRILRAATWEHAKTRRHHPVRPIKLLIFFMWKMGARPREVLQYRWDMIRWSEGTHGKIHIPAHIVKTRRKRAIHLNSVVSRYLRLRQSSSTSPWIFPGRLPGAHQGEYAKSWDRVAAAAGLDEATIYWLRGSFITDALERGFSSVFIGKYCDTSSKMIEKRYAKAKNSIMEGIAQ